MNHDPLFELLSRFLPGEDDNTRYEAIAPLSAKSNAEWDKLLSDIERAKSRVTELEAKKKIYWSKLERKLGIFDRDLKIEAGIVMGEVEKDRKCTSPGERLSIPGFCDGNCDECALKPDIDENHNLF